MYKRQLLGREQSIFDNLGRSLGFAQASDFALLGHQGRIPGMEDALDTSAHERQLDNNWLNFMQQRELDRRAQRDIQNLARPAARSVAPQSREPWPGFGSLLDKLLSGNQGSGSGTPSAPVGGIFGGAPAQPSGGAVDQGGGSFGVSPSVSNALSVPADVPPMIGGFSPIFGAY